MNPDFRYLVMGMGCHKVCCFESHIFSFEVHQSVVPARLFISPDVANDFLIWKIATVHVADDKSEHEESVLLSPSDPVPASLFSSIVGLSNEVLEKLSFKAKDIFVPQYPWHLKMSAVKKGDFLRLGVTNINYAARNIVGGFLAVSSEDKS